MIEVISFLVGVLSFIGGPAIAWFVKERLILWWYLHVGSEEAIKAKTLRVIARRSCPFPHPRNVGTFSTVHVEWFVDIFSAVIDLEDRRTIEQCLTRWIQLAVFSGDQGIGSIDRVAVPKLGNVLLADVVACRLRRPLIVIRQQAEQFILPGQAIEGSLNPGDRILLIDDISSDVEFLMRCVQEIQRANAEVIAVVTLIDRKEGSCGEEFKLRKIPFAPLHTMSDSDIRAGRLRVQ